jgi:hypothetical protein
MKQTGRKVYKSMQGKTVDMDLLRQRNELTPAVGNARVNARGDELGPGGQVIKKREEVLKGYYEQKGGLPEEVAVKQPTKDLTEDWEEPAPVKTRSTKKSADPEWIEDADGNFVPKGE